MLPIIANEEGVNERQKHPIARGPDLCERQTDPPTRPPETRRPSFSGTEPRSVRPPEISRPRFSDRPKCDGRTLGERLSGNSGDEDDLLQESRLTPVSPPDVSKLKPMGFDKVKRPGRYKVESTGPRLGHSTTAAMASPASEFIDLSCEPHEHPLVRDPYSGLEVQEVVEALKDQKVHIVHMGVEEETPHVVSNEGSDDLFQFPRGSQAVIILFQKKSLKRTCAFLQSMRQVHMVFPPVVALMLKLGAEAVELDSVQHMADSLLKSGAEAIMIQPRKNQDLPQLLASSLGTVRAQHDLKKSAVNERANQMFFQDAYTWLNGFPRMNDKIAEVDPSQGKCGSVGKHVFLRMVGCGKYGKVYLFKNSDGQPEVAKVIAKANIKSTKHVKQILKECQMLHKVMGHPHIVKFRGITHARRNLYIFMDFAGELDLEQMMNKSGGGGLDSACVHRIIIQLADAVSHCHRNNVAHRDLKPENVVINSSTSALLVDFGLAVKANELCEDKCGTVPFSPPEVYRGLAYEPKSMDVWGLGIVLLHMLCGNHSLLKMMNYPCLPEPDRELADALLVFFDQNDVLPWPMKIKKWNPDIDIGSDLLNAMKSALHIDPKGRCSAQSFHEHISNMSRMERKSDLARELDVPMTARRAPAALPPVRITVEVQSDASIAAQDSRPTFS